MNQKNKMNIKSEFRSELLRKMVGAALGAVPARAERAEQMEPGFTRHPTRFVAWRCARRPGRRSAPSLPHFRVRVKLILGMVALSLSALSLSSAAEPSLIPQPEKMARREGFFTLAPETRIDTDSASEDTGRLLADRLKKSTGWRFKINRGAAPEQGGIVITTRGADPRLGAEGYELVVSTNAVLIRAPAQAGLFYGMQTLLQLLPAEIFSAQPVRGIAWTIPCVEISDSPRFAWRGFMLDVSRHFYTEAEVKHVLDLMALYKLNTFHWHLVDDQGWRIQIKKYPNLTKVGAWRSGIGFGLASNSATAYDSKGRYGGFYTQSEIREIVAYAAARHITVVPEIEMPGHSSAALMAYPQFGCPGVKFAMPTQGGVFTGVYCAGNDEAFTFLNNVLSEVMPLFPGKYIHIGGDEVVKSNWIACAQCQARIKGEGLKNEKELQAYFIRRIEKIVSARGKNLIGWSEIREGGLAPGAALMDWIGGGAEAAASGHDVVMSPGKFCYFDHYQSTNRAAEPKAIGGLLPLAQVYSFEPVPQKLAPEFAGHVLGGQANLWTEYVPNLRQVEYMMFPRLGALAEVDWSPKSSRDWENFKSRAAQNEKRLDAMGVNYRPLSMPD